MWHSVTKQALLPHGSGFRVQGSVRNFADAKQGEGSWTLASVHALHLPSVAVQIFRTESQVRSLGPKFGVRSSEFGQRVSSRGMRYGRQGEVIS